MTTTSNIIDEGCMGAPLAIPALSEGWAFKSRDNFVVKITQTKSGSEWVVEI